MFEARRTRSTLSLALNMLQLTYFAAARQVRQKHRNAIWAIVLSVVQSMLFIAAFYVMFTVLGQRSVSVRGDFMLYLMTGIFAYLTHIQAVQQVMNAEGPTSAMMQHAPMNTLVSILSTALSVLYIKTVSLFVLLLVLHTLFTPLDIHYWPGAFLMFLLAWSTGCVIGIVLMAAKPWAPDLVHIIQLVYVRANMIASGKMFVANMLPTSIIAFFDWNPLFHIIDQSRGFVFRNYFPHHSNWEYPLYFTLVGLLIGFMAEAYTRKHASASWSAGR
ncbi:ABC transporter permease [Roseicyclus persicicus]|uniref:ABC transporter permease n=1 Tax=Roseicyclus persicicus TaxID=2650661 RepID=A0A7X6H0U0_9RHOB|nr:ABC transporter permease [Roseibacterium persicicum]NKX45113.1 ABC transporter permease [Roseibacterium persicicum]